MPLFVSGCSGPARPLPRGHDEHSQALRGGYLEHDQCAAGGTRRGERGREHPHASGEDVLETVRLLDVSLLAGAIGMYARQAIPSKVSRRIECCCLCR